MEGRRSLKPSTLVRFQALGTKVVLAWCTAHRRIYKPLRSRLEHGLGSTPSASTMRSKPIRMSRRFLIVRQLVRFQPDAPSFGNCGRMVRRSTFNRDGESSILLAGTKIAHRRESVVRESVFVPFVQWIRTERCERSDSGSSPERDTKL